MLVAQTLHSHDDGTYMLGPDTYRAPIRDQYHDWRFGRNGIPHPATCATCGRRSDPRFISPSFRVKRRTRDITSTLDGYTMVSTRFRDFCLRKELTGLEFARLPADPDFFVFRPRQRLRFDDERRRTRFEKPCPECGGFYNVIGGTPAFLVGVDAPIAEGFFRSDLEFGSGHTQHPLIIVGLDTASQLASEVPPKASKYYFKPVET